MRPLRTNLLLDPLKLAEAKQLTGLKTTRAVVDFALARLTATSKALSQLFHLARKIHFRKGYSYKRSRG